MARVSKKCWNEWISKKAVANAGVVVVNLQNQALLLFKEKYQEWEIPSGAIDKDEEPEGAAVRELDEETHIKVNRKKLKRLGVVTAKHPDRKEDKTDIIVTFMTSSNASVHLDGDEGHTKSQWLPLQRFNDITIPMHEATRKQLKMAYGMVGKRKASKRVPNG